MFIIQSLLILTCLNDFTNFQRVFFIFVESMNSIVPDHSETRAVLVFATESKNNVDPNCNHRPM